MVGSKLAGVCLAVASACAWAEEPCEVLTDESNHECFKNVMWAKTEGIKEDPKWYEDMPFLNATSAMEDFQYALSIGEAAHGEGRKWNCKLPCNLTSEAKAHYDALLAASAASAASASEPISEGPTDAPDTTTAAASSGMDWYWYVLIGLGVCCCLPLVGIACSAFICYESVSWMFEGSGKRAPKKKRAVRAKAESPLPAAEVTPAPAPAPLVAPTAVQTYAVPTYQHVTYSPAPARSVIVAPAVRVASTVPYTTAPVTYTAAPASQYFTTPTGH